MGTLVPLSSEGLEEETTRPRGATLQPSLIVDSVHGVTKLHKGRKEERKGSFIHVQNTTYSQDLNVGMADSKLIVKTCTAERSSVPKAVTHHFTGSSKWHGVGDYLHMRKWHREVGYLPNVIQLVNGSVGIWTQATFQCSFQYFQYSKAIFLKLKKMCVIKEAYREVQYSTAEKIRGAAVEVEGLSWTISPPTLPVGRESSRQPLSKCGGGSTHIRNIWDNYIRADS